MQTAGYWERQEPKPAISAGKGSSKIMEKDRQDCKDVDTGRTDTFGFPHVSNEKLARRSLSTDLHDKQHRHQYI
ncbi:hypothetical protein QFZ96_002536 [Paraburkholderia youngii]